MTFSLGKRSLSKLEGVHSDLQKVIKSAISISEVDFSVLEGLRSITRQKILYYTGKSKTLDSRHLTGHAVDLGAYVDGSICWDASLYDKINNAMQKASSDLEIPIVWGGSWKTLKDLDHWELDRNAYP